MRDEPGRRARSRELGARSDVLGSFGRRKTAGSLELGAWSLELGAWSDVLGSFGRRKIAISY